MEYSPSLTLGLLPKEKKDFSSIALSGMLNLSVLIVALLFGHVAHQVVQKHFETSELVFPSTPAPIPVPKPVFHVETPKNIATLQIRPANIQSPVNHPLPPVPRPVRVNLPAPTPILVPQRVAIVHLAPQPKLTNAFNSTTPVAPALHAHVAAASFGVSQSNPNAASSAHVAPVGSVFGSAATTLSRSQNVRVASSGFGIGPIVGSGRVRGQVKSVQFSAPAAKSVITPLHSIVKETSVVVTDKPIPQYTEEARKLGIQGNVILDVTFTATGQVEIVRIVQGLGHGLDQQAEAAVKKIRFKPATKDGSPVAVTTRISIMFELA